MVQYVKVSEYAIQAGVSERTVRNWIQKGKLSTTTKLIDNRSTLVIIVENNSEVSEPTVKKHDSEIQDPSEVVQDAEFVDSSNTYNLVSMEKSTFDKLIENLKALSDSRAESDKNTIANLQKEYFETKAENKTLIEDIKKLNDELTSEKIKSAQSEAEIKILSLRVKELENNALSTENKSGFWNFINSSQRL